jgi:hypothetical protein
MSAILYGATVLCSTRVGPFVCRLHGGTDFGTPLLIQKVGTIQILTVYYIPASRASFLSFLLLVPFDQSLALPIHVPQL